MSPSPIQVRYETLLEVAQSIVAHRQLSTLFTDLSRCLKSLVTFDFIVLTLLDAKSQTVRLHILETDRAVVGEEQHEVAGEETPTTLALRERRPYYAPDAQALGRFPRLQRLIQANGCESFCTLPLFTAQCDLGGLTFGSTQKSAYSPEDIEFMEHVARQVAIAVENALNGEAARVYEGQLAQERDRLRALLEVNNAAVSCLSMKSLFQTVASALRRIFGLDFASIMTYDGEKDVLRLKVLDFPDSQGAMQEDAEIPVANTLAGIIFRGREGRVLEAEDIRRLSPVTSTIMEREGLRSICATPMIFLGKALGMLSVGSRQAGFFNPADILFYTQVAGQIAIAFENALSFKRIEELNAHLAEEKVYLEDEIRTDNRFEDIIGQSRALKAILKQVETVAPTDSTVLIYGETGTGKELLARAIHDLSARRQGTFVKLNCAAIPTGLLESEMFGHEKGAFTGAIAQRVGRFELAHRGTMFMDEVGEIPLELQTKLLRVLQEREFERLGSSRTIQTDARLVTATNRNLAEMVEQRQFRADLYYRLNVFPITAPALRERREDIPLLVRYFVQQFARRMNRRITHIPAESMQALERYAWPGNIRELQNFIERAVILSQGTSLEAPVRELTRVPVRPAPPAAAPASAVTLADAEREAIERALEESGGKVGGESGAAARLGMKRTTLQAKMRKLGLDKSK
ncbi:MAG: sigma 54-interacting transcriptional regulator [Bryobacteraceae bacterium]|jgi:formate hydrogenlyase transcriptional activator